MAFDEALVQRVWSVQQIRQLAYRYAHSVDSRNLKLVARFTRSSMSAGGRERILAKARSRGP